MATKPATNKLPKAALPEMDSLAAIVLSTIPGPDKSVREDVRAGAHQVDLTYKIRVCGELRVGEDAPVTQVNKLKPWALAKLLADKVSPAVLDECIHMALAAATAPAQDDARVEAMEAEADNLKARVEAVFIQAGSVVRQTRKGSTSLHGSITVEVEE
jgi:hypothetical protein